MAVTEMEMLFAEADDANIPVDIWLELDGERWVLRASNYMPRKGYVHDGAYRAEADTREELVALLEQHVLPLYRTAVSQLEDVCRTSGEGHLYYWQLTRQEGE